MQYIKERFKNKLRVILIPMPERESVSLSLWIKVGGRYENMRNLGISHFLEHLVFRGTKKRSAREIKESIEGIGGAINAFTAEEFTCFYVKVPKRYIQKGIDVISDIVLNPLMQIEDIKKEKKIIVEEIRMYKDMPSYHVHDLLHEIMYPKHPLGRPLTGTYNSVNRMSREMLKDFKEEFYISNNMVLAIAGSFNVNKALKDSKAVLGSLKPKINMTAKEFSSKQKSPRVNLFNKDTEQIHLSLGFHSFYRTHPDRYALSLLSVILGGNMSSRLFEKVREEYGLAYQISSSSEKYQDAGSFTINAGIKNKNILDAMALIFKELERIKQETVKVDELKKAKDFIGGQLLIGLEATIDRMLWMGEKTITNDTILSLEDILRKIKSISQDDIRRIANNILKGENLNLAIIGPVQKKTKDIKKLINNF